MMRMTFDAARPRDRAAIAPTLAALAAVPVLILLGAGSPAAAEEPMVPLYEVPAVTVEGTAEGGFDDYLVNPEAVHQPAPDTASLIKRVPGAAVIDNGPLSSQTQYRGLFGPRMNVRIDGMSITPGGPNWMDPPLHYLPRTLVDSIEVIRGISPVSAGDQTIAGTIMAKSQTSHFTKGPAPEFHGRTEVIARSVDSSGSAGTILSLSNNHHRVHAVASGDLGADTDFGNGTIKDTAYRRYSGGFGYGFTQGDDEIALDYRHSKTGRTGNPSLPMDIAFIDTNILRGEYKGRWGDVRVSGKLNYSDVGHRMANFELRPLPATPRFVDAQGKGLGYDLKAVFAAGGGELTLGTDGHIAGHDMTVFDPGNAAFFVTQFNDAEQNRYGVFGEWTRRLGARWTVELGLRYTRVDMDAGAVDALPARMMAPPRRLRDAFNGADHSRSDNNVDWVAKLKYRFTPDIEAEIGLARKTRSPGYVERYLWLPLEVSSGLADGNNYVGNIGLDPEVAHQAEIGIDWTGDRFWLSPRAFYHRIGNYIQGTAATNGDVIAVSTLNGDSTPLRFTNVDAEIYGMDAEMGVVLAAQWQASAVLSYVRGKRRDINDNLYRIAPPNATVDLTHRHANWSATLEGVFVASQDNISATIVKNEPSTSNQGTPGHVLLNLFGRWSPMEGLEIAAGIDNLLDKSYRDHLSGFNRVAASDVPLGTRLPGPGRNIFAQLAYRW